MQGVRLSKAFASIISFYDGLPTRVQFAVNWFLRAFIASLFFSFVSNIATFAYAIKYGARPPVEGVPYLSVTVGVFGFLLIIVTVLAIYGLPFVVAQLQRLSRIIISAVGSPSPKVGPPSPRGRRLRRISQNLVSAGILFTFLGINELVQPGSIKEVLEQWLELVSGLTPGIREWTEQMQGPTLVWVVATAAFFPIAALAVAGVSALSPKVLRYASNAVYFASILTIVVFSIHSPIQQASFEQVLRLSRFGGGMPVTVYLSDGTILENKHLFITSADMVTLYDAEAQVFREINHAHILEMRYGRSTGWVLPPQREWDEIWRPTQSRRIAPSSTRQNQQASDS